MIDNLECIDVYYQKMGFKYYKEIDLLVKNIIKSDIEEECRYMNHDNFNDSYKDYMTNVYNEIKPYINGKVIDYGCGRNHILADMMNSEYYDLYFHKTNLSKYDSIVLIEVVEHFHTLNEYNKLVSLLNDNGSLIIKTNLLTSSIDLNKWWYLRDDTHYIFHSIKTFEFLCNKLSLEIIHTNNKDFIVLKKK